MPDDSPVGRRSQLGIRFLDDPDHKGGNAGRIYHTPEYSKGALQAGYKEILGKLNQLGWLTNALKRAWVSGEGEISSSFWSTSTQRW